MGRNLRQSELADGLAPMTPPHDDQHQVLPVLDHGKCQSRRAAAIGSDVRFLIGKRTLGMAPVNDRFWPKAAVALKPSRMSELGLPSNFVRNRLLLLRSGYVRELAAASYLHI